MSVSVCEFQKIDDSFFWENGKDTEKWRSRNIYIRRRFVRGKVVVRNKKDDL